MAEDGAVETVHGPPTAAHHRCDPLGDRDRRSGSAFAVAADPVDGALFEDDVIPPRRFLDQVEIENGLDESEVRQLIEENPVEAFAVRVRT